MDNLNELIKRLKNSVAYAEGEDMDMNAKSWGMEEGCLISYNDAKLIIEQAEGQRVEDVAEIKLQGCSKCGKPFVVSPDFMGVIICEDCDPFMKVDSAELEKQIEFILYKHWQAWVNDTFENMDTTKESFKKNFESDFVRAAMKEYGQYILNQNKK